MKRAPCLPRFSRPLSLRFQRLRPSHRAHGGRLRGELRALVGGWVAVLAVWAHLFGHGGWRGDGLPMFVLSGMVGFGLGDLGLFAALPLLGPRLTALMVQCLAAPMAALIEWLWLGTRLDARQLSVGQ